MIIVDRALRGREDVGRPVQVGLVGAGFAGRGVAAQIHLHTPGMRMAVVANRTLAQAAKTFTDIGVDDFLVVSSAAELSQAITRGTPAITDDPSLVTESTAVEGIVEATGEIEFGARTVLSAIQHGKHVVLLNSELDCTLGPILKRRADSAGVVFTDADGDQPVALINLAREVEMMGFRPVVLGNIKSLLDHRRTPETQKGFAERVFQRTKHITSFADGTKIAAEMCVVANASGFGVLQRGMEGPTAQRVEEAADLFPAEELAARGEGVVDYLLGAEPSFGIFVLAHSEDRFQQRYMKIYKMGDGPIYMFHRPYHLGPIETPLSVARAVLFGDAAAAPLGGPVCDVVALAKFDLRSGTRLDGIGGFTVYGTLESHGTVLAQNLLPMGLAEGCALKRDISQDAPITFDDVELPAGRVSDQLWREQVAATW